MFNASEDTEAISDPIFGEILVSVLLASYVYEDLQVYGVAIKRIKLRIMKSPLTINGAFYNLTPMTIPKQSFSLHDSSKIFSTVGFSILFSLHISECKTFFNIAQSFPGTYSYSNQVREKLLKDRAFPTSILRMVDHIG